MDDALVGFKDGRIFVKLYVIKLSRSRKIFKFAALENGFAILLIRCLRPLSLESAENLRTPVERKGGLH